MRTSLVSVLLTAVLLAGCSSGGDEAGPDEEPSSPSSSTGSSAPSTPSPTPGDGVAPATGPELQLTGASVRMPEGWEPDPTNTQDILVASGRLGTLSEGMGVVALPGCCVPLDEQVKRVNELRKAGDRPERLPDLSLDGSPAFHLAGPLKAVPGVWEVTIGGDHVDHQYTLSFTLRNTSRAERDALVESVVASWEWQ